MTSGRPVEDLLEPRRWLLGRYSSVQALWAVAAVALLGFGVAELAQHQWHAPLPVSTVSVLLMTLSIALLPARPLLVTTVVALAVGLNALVWTTPQTIAGFFAFLLVAGGAARYAAGWRLWAVLGLVTATILVFALRDPTEGNPFDYVFTFGMAATATFAGLAVRHRQHALLRAVELAVAERTAYQLGLSRAVVDERARIARDLHDVVAHAVSLIVIQAAAGRAVAPRDPGRATAAFDTIEASGQRALADLRRLLGVLRTDQPQEAHPPGLAAVEELALQVQEAGVPCAVHWRGERDGVPEGVDVAAFRVVQESVTNALKHGSRAGVDITLTHGDAGLRVDVLDRAVDGVAARQAELAGAGRGLQGMRERVDLYDGTLAAGPQPQGWRVEAFFPVVPR